VDEPALSEAPATAEPEPTTLLGLIDAVEPAMAQPVAYLTQLARDGAFAADGEIRRGLLAINGAGLVAVTSLLGNSIHPLAIHLAAGLYFVDLVSGCANWY
jgi:hypothetical protein